MTGEVLLEVLLRVEPTELYQLIRQHRPDDGAIGDCWRTCIACLLGASRPDLVPHFVADNGDVTKADDFVSARRWLRRNEGLDLAFIEPADAWRLGVPAIATVSSKTGPWRHSVIVRNREVVWCPSTGRPGDYSMGDVEALDEPVEVLCRPYQPDPDTQLADWRLLEEAAPCPPTP